MICGFFFRVGWGRPFSLTFFLITRSGFLYSYLVCLTTAFAYVPCFRRPLASCFLVVVLQSVAFLPLLHALGCGFAIFSSVVPPSRVSGIRSFIFCTVRRWSSPLARSGLCPFFAFLAHFSTFICWDPGWVQSTRCSCVPSPLLPGLVIISYSCF